MVATALLSGLLLGLSAGITPGPLLTLVVSETLRHGSRAGARVALAPLFTDVPIMALTLAAVDGLSRFQPALAGIAAIGGLVVLRLAWDCLKARGFTPEPDLPEAQISSLGKGVAVNFLSPHPWLFWFSVGSPLLLRAYSDNPVGAVGFVAAFYLLLVGSKLLLARLVGRYRRLLSGPAYLWTMRTLGLVLLFFALFFFRQSYVFFQS